MSENQFWGILAIVFIIYIVLIILSERKKSNIRDKIIEKYDFESNGFKAIKAKKNYVRKSKNGFEFIWLNKKTTHFTLTIGINFIPTVEYKNRSLVEDLKFNIGFHKRNKKSQLLGQKNPILISKFEIKKESEIPDFDEIYKYLTKVLKNERLTMIACNRMPD